jgi:hypothetical protein
VAHRVLRGKFRGRVAEDRPLRLPGRRPLSRPDRDRGGVSTRAHRDHRHSLSRHRAPGGRVRVDPVGVLFGLRRTDPADLEFTACKSSPRGP